MTDPLRKAAEMALQQLQRDDVYLGHRSKTRADAIQALRQALAQPEQEPYASQEAMVAHMSDRIRICPKTGDVSIGNADAVNMSQERVDETEKHEHEPVAWMWKDGSLTTDPYEADGTWTKLYTAPPKREWVEITKGECDELFRSASDHVEYAYAIEAKLKEKNGYPTCPPCTHDCNEGRDCPARKVQP